MTITDAVIARTDELLEERNLTKKELAQISGLPRETITSIYKKLTKSVTLTTIKGISSGFGMTMSAFLDCEYFTDEWLSSEPASDLG